MYRQNRSIDSIALNTTKSGKLVCGGVLDVEGEIVAIKLSVALLQLDGDIIVEKVTVFDDSIEAESVVKT